MIKVRQKSIEKFKSEIRKITFIFGIIASLAVATLVYLSTDKFTLSLVGFFSTFAAISSYNILKVRLELFYRIKKMESVFPDFLQLMSSNLRAGMTTEIALLMAARKEFYPLDLEIGKVGKELMTGKEIDFALEEMAKRINSDKIKKTVDLITSGIVSGGNISILLEETASHLREREFIQKRASSNVLMYVIFIFAAITFGAPLLFGLSSVLVEILSNVLSTLPEVQTNVNVPFTLSKIDIPLTFITYFSVVFLLTIGIIGSIVIGLVMKGEEKEGLKYSLPIAGISLAIFFLSRIFLLKYFADFFNIG